MEDVDKDENGYEGECFVFDSRVTVDSNLSKGNFEQCYGCRRPITEEDKLSEYCERVSCARCHDKTSDQQKASFAEREKQVNIAKSRGKEHIGNNE